MQAHRYSPHWIVQALLARIHTRFTPRPIQRPVSVLWPRIPEARQWGVMFGKWMLNKPTKKETTMPLRLEHIEFFMKTAVPLSNLIAGERFTDISGKKRLALGRTYKDRSAGCPLATDVNVAGDPCGDPIAYVHGAMVIRGWLRKREEIWGDPNVVCDIGGRDAMSPSVLRAMDCFEESLQGQPKR